MWYDAIILALLIFSTMRGASKGFAWQVATIGAIVLCFLFAGTASQVIAPMISVDPPLNRWIAMLVLYIGASFVSFAMARAVRGTLKRWQFEEFDSHLGALFGFMRGIVFALILTFFAVTLSKSLREHVLTSHSGYAAGRILFELHPVLPNEFHGVIDPYLEKLGHTVVHDDHHDSGHDYDPSDEFGENPNPPSITPPEQPTTPPRWEGELPPGDFGPIPHQERPRITSTPPTAPPTSEPTDSTNWTFDRVLNEIPDDLKDSAVKAWDNTDPQDRDELLSKFKSSVPGVIKAVTHEWSEGKPIDAELKSWQDKTLQDIASVYTKDPEGQRNIVEQAQALLRGVPDQVGRGVLQDWYADLYQIEGEDPDPETNFETRLDVRIRRQLEANNITLDRVRAELRNRLGGGKQ